MTVREREREGGTLVLPAVGEAQRHSAAEVPVAPAVHQRVALLRAVGHGAGLFKVTAVQPLRGRCKKRMREREREKREKQVLP